MTLWVPDIGKNLDLGVAWASTRILPDIKTKKGEPYVGVFFTSRDTYALVHQFTFRHSATREAVAVLWDHALAKLGVREPTTMGAKAMLEHDNAGRYRRGGHMRFYGHVCRVLDVSVSTDYTVLLSVEHPTAGELRIVLDKSDNLVEWASEPRWELCA